MSKLIIVGRSELDSFRQCPLKHRFGYVEGWHLPPDHWGQSEKSEKGTMWHAVLAAHWRMKQVIEAGGGTYDKRTALEVMQVEIDQVIQQYVNHHGLTAEGAMERRAMLDWMAQGYLERWGVDPDWEVLEVESSMTIPFADPDAPDEPPVFGMRINPDMVFRMRSNGRKGILDAKTVEKSNGLWTSGDADLDDQQGLYLRGLARLEPEDPPIIAMLDQARRDRLKTREMDLHERFARPKTVRTARELDEIERDALSDMYRMYGEENLARPSSHPDVRQCGWKCEFKEAHIVLRKSGGQWDRAREVLVAHGMTNDPATHPAHQKR